MTFSLPHQRSESMAGGAFYAADEDFRHSVCALACAGKYCGFAGSEPNFIGHFKTLEKDENNHSMMNEAGRAIANVSRFRSHFEDCQALIRLGYANIRKFSSLLVHLHKLHSSCLISISSHAIKIIAALFYNAALCAASACLYS
ncbi:hypothetical protein METHB2_160028 [Candidatus Methylobacter favarea]|uniref:Uncharacterized protein n=1 Tax=Candidatus Methylobacter favarea TaxID=2707345 RepID=A0A8S0WHP2_9GAMM|nr:hypothetical protein METHB2_160028 [Candidatus Methylobacter favarea]